MASPPFGLPPLDEMFAGVVMITRQSVDLSHGVMVPDQTTIVLCQPNVLPPGRISFFNFRVHGDHDLIFLTGTHASWMRRAPSPAQGLLPDVVELRAGCAGMDTGASFLGGRIRVSADINELATQHLVANNHGHVWKDPQPPSAIYAHCPDPVGSITLGFPCQPFSSQGHQLGIADRTYEVFIAGLKIIR